MADSDLWFDLAQSFENLDPDGYINLFWIFDPATQKCNFKLEWEAVAPLETVPPRNREGHIQLVDAKFRALAARAGRRLGFADDSKAWFYAIKKASPNSDPHILTTTDPLSGAERALLTGRVLRLCQKSAELCYRVEANPSAYMANADISTVTTATASPVHQFRRRADWLTGCLKERGWDKNEVERMNGPDRKTTQKILNGLFVREAILQKLVSALNRKKVKSVSITLSDVPSD
jgi:hypothetical protein